MSGEQDVWPAEYVRRTQALSLAVQLGARTGMSANQVLRTADDFDHWLHQPPKSGRSGRPQPVVPQPRGRG